MLRPGCRRLVRRFLESRALTVCLMAVYLVVLAWVILLKMELSLDVVGTIRSVNLIPLAGATVINGATDYREVVQNVLAFAPFGLYLGMLQGGRSPWRALAAIAAVSLSFEALQFAFSLGATDVTDLIANTLGGALGLALYALVRRALRSEARVLRIANAVVLAVTVFMLALVGLLLVANW